MTKQRLYLIVQTAICVLLAVLVSFSAVQLCREGVARKLDDPLAPIYTRELAVERLSEVIPLFCAFIGMVFAGIALGVRGSDEPARRKSIKDMGSYTPKAGACSPHRLRVTRSVCILVAIVFILMGILNGSARDVLYKAINICTECIGLG